jgi:hypothetical protein
VGYIKESRISEYISYISVDTRKYIITQDFKHNNKFLFRATIYTAASPITVYIYIYMYIYNLDLDVSFLIPVTILVASY